MNQSQYQPTDADFDQLDAADALPINKKAVIAKHLTTFGLPSKAENVKLVHENGTMIQDTFLNYLSANDFYSTGSLAKLANGTPLDFQYDTTDALKAEIEKYKDRSHFELGTFVHEAVLEPQEWSKVVCEPKANRASHEGCDELIRFWLAQTGGAVMTSSTDKLDAKKQLINDLILRSGCRSVSEKDALIVNKLAERWASYQNGIWSQILDAAIKEVSVYANDYKGLPMRVRPDGLLFENQIGVNAIVSVKTTSASSIREYKYQFSKLGYDIKEAAYQKVVSHVTGLDFSTTINIVLSTSEPFHVGVFILSDGDMRVGAHRFETAVQIAKTCIDLEYFPGWNDSLDQKFGLIDLEIYQ